MTDYIWWPEMSISALIGNRTYIVCAIMAVVACVGMAVGQMSGEQATHMLLEALALFFLRAGIENGNEE